MGEEQVHDSSDNGVESKYAETLGNSPLQTKLDIDNNGNYFKTPNDDSRTHNQQSRITDEPKKSVFNEIDGENFEKNSSNALNRHVFETMGDVANISISPVSPFSKDSNSYSALFNEKFTNRLQKDKKEIPSMEDIDKEFEGPRIKMNN
jgi:hypothetical protein